MYAIIKTGGKQYKVSEGDILNVDKLSKEVKEIIEFTEVLAVNNGTVLATGETVANAVVTAQVIVEGRDKKVISFKKLRRKDSKLKRGFRRSFTRVIITKIAT